MDRHQHRCYLGVSQSKINQIFQMLLINPCGKLLQRISETKKLYVIRNLENVYTNKVRSSCIGNPRRFFINLTIGIKLLSSYKYIYFYFWLFRLAIYD